MLRSPHKYTHTHISSSLSNLQYCQTLANMQFKRVALNAWMEWNRRCKAKKLKYIDAAAWNSYFLSRRTFNSWLAHLQLRRERDYNEYLANHTYEQSLLKSLCLFWKSRARARIQSKAQDALVFQVHRLHIKKNVLKKWLFYTESRKIKQQTCGKYF